MATRKRTPPTAPASSDLKPVKAPALDAVGSILATVSAPSSALIDETSIARLDTESQQRLATQKVGAQAATSAMPNNPLKAGEHGLDNGHNPMSGATVEPLHLIDTASSVTEDTASAKLGSGVVQVGRNAGNGPLDRVRADNTGQALTTNFGVKIADNQNSLKAGLRGPTLLEDFVLREKINHFDHERIPERIVHARGSGAHGYFESYEALGELTKASLFAEAGKRTPVFVRFSTVVGERGAADLTRDVRGFAVKFYTDEGNWDIVGNNIPVFFIQDAMKFPDLVHAVKPEPHNAIPQGASAHDTFWDFAGLMPEITHMLLWVMSDRALPRSYRTMQGFGVNTFRLVNAAGASVFVKFHWTPLAGTHSVLWDEAVKINGADSDFHRRDLWEAIEGGAYPEYELAFQVFTEEQADAFTFDVLDCTKLVPEELVPLRAVGKMVLNRNPDNFFAETEQVAFATHHVVPGIDFSNDPLLHGRHFSYLDTQMSRLGGPNFQELPINASVAEVHNNQRDGMHRQSIPRGRVAYEPNSLGGGCPFQAGMMTGFKSFPAPVFEDKVRGKPEKFADHFSQATLFWNSQTPVEKKHIIGAFRFELTRVQVPAIRERIVSMLANVADELAKGVADGIGIALPAPQPRVLETPVKSELDASPTLSMFARPGDGGIKGRRVALLVCAGVDAAPLKATHEALAKAGAVPRFVGARLGKVTAADGSAIHVEASMEAMPSVLWDAVVVPGDDAAQATLASYGQALEFVKDQYRHCKPMLVFGGSTTLLDEAGIPSVLPSGEADPGLVLAGANAKADNKADSKAEQGDRTGGARLAVTTFIAALAKHRHFEREMDPPLV